MYKNYTQDQGIPLLPEAETEILLPAQYNLRHKTVYIKAT